MLKRVWLVAAILAGGVGAAWAEAGFTAAVVRESGAAVASAFGPRGEAWHAGADITAPPGAAVHAPADGRVARVRAPGELDGYHGQVVEIDHGALGKTRFSNLEGVALETGDEVHAGDVVGRIAAQAGSDSPHVHVELWRDRNLIDPATELTLFGSP